MKRIFYSIISLIIFGIMFILFPLVACGAETTPSNNEIPIATVCEEAIREEPTVSSSSVPLTREEQMQHDMETVAGIQDTYLHYRSYLNVCNKYADICDPPETIYDYYSDEDIELICRMVETETHGADIDSKINVAIVVFNRLESDLFPDEVSEVIVPGQFCYGRTEITDETRAAVEIAFMFELNKHDSLFFKSGKQTSTFSGAQYSFTDNVGHHFYAKN